MDVDQDPQGQGNPPGIPFDHGFTPSTTRGHATPDPTGSVYTENYFTPLYAESQATDHTNVNTNQHSTSPMRTRLEALRDAKLPVAAAAPAINQQPPTPEDI
jgi:hypothetical protein